MTAGSGGGRVEGMSDFPEPGAKAKDRNLSDVLRGILQIIPTEGYEDLRSTLEHMADTVDFQPPESYPEWWQRAGRAPHKGLGDPTKDSPRWLQRAVRVFAGLPEEPPDKWEAWYELEDRAFAAERELAELKHEREQALSAALNNTAVRDEFVGRLVAEREQALASAKEVSGMLGECERQRNEWRERARVTLDKLRAATNEDGDYNSAAVGQVECDLAAALAAGQPPQVVQAVKVEVHACPPDAEVVLTVDPKGGEPTAVPPVEFCKALLEHVDAVRAMTLHGWREEVLRYRETQGVVLDWATDAAERARIAEERVQCAVKWLTALELRAGGLTTQVELLEVVELQQALTGNVMPPVGDGAHGQPKADGDLEGTLACLRERVVTLERSLTDARQEANGLRDWSKSTNVRFVALQERVQAALAVQANAADHVSALQAIAAMRAVLSWAEPKETK